MSGRGAALLALVTLAYPFAVFVAIRHDQTWALWVMAALGLTLALLRLGRPASTTGAATSVPAAPGSAAPASRVSASLSLLAPVMLAVLALVGHFTHWPRLALVWPVLVNLTFLATFAISLQGTPIVERFARLQDPDLTPDKIAYCRAVTKVWCGFFVLNAAVIGALALARDLRWWTLYAGAISYVLIGLLFAVELIVRHSKFGWDMNVSLPHRIGMRLLSFWRRTFAR
jgi:uncharacterized membrane protein